MSAKVGSEKIDGRDSPFTNFENTNYHPFDNNAINQNQSLYSADLQHEIFDNTMYDSQSPLESLIPIYQTKLSSRLKRGRMNEMLIKLNNQSKQMTNQYLSGPSIPAKNQKILKTSPHAQKVNRYLQGNMKYNHKREKSFQKDLDESFSKDVISLSKQRRPSSIMRQKRRGFDTSAHRFDKK